MLFYYIQLLLVLLLSVDQGYTLEIPNPIFENADFSTLTDLFRALSGDKVRCHLEPSSIKNITDIRYKSILILKNDQNEETERIKPILSESTFIQIDTHNLNKTNTYSCCIKISIENGSPLQKCSVLQVSTSTNDDITLIAKMVVLTEMLLIVVIVSFCLLSVCRGFKLKQKQKEIEAIQKFMENSESKGFGGPYLISPNAKFLETGIRYTQNGQALKKENSNDVKTLNTMLPEYDFPPTYEELVLRRIESQIESVRY